MEKIVTKCLCKVLDGLSQNELISLPDAVELIAEKAKQAEQSNKKPVNEFSALINELITTGKKDKEEPGDEDVSDESDQEHSEDEEDGKLNVQDEEMMDSEVVRVI